VFAWGEVRLVYGVAVVVAVLSCAVFGSMARANEYRLSGPIVQRPGLSGNDFGYRGPQFKVTPWGTSSDRYDCPSGQSISNWVVVGDVADSVDRAFSAMSTGVGNQVKVNVTDWSLSTVYLRLAGSCTTAPGEFPYPPPRFSVYPPGDFQSYWDGVFRTGAPGTAQYGELIKRAFCWSSTYPRCSPGTSNGASRFPLHNGTNTISLTFKHPSLRRPPAVRLVGAAGCSARRMHLAVHNQSGYLRLELRCQGLKQSAAARVRIADPVRVSFPLRRGSGSVLVRLAKPPGTVAPYAHLSYGRADKSCSNVRYRLRLGSRTFALRVNARCGRAAGNAAAHLDIGGLLQ
jgi:hypothetical protein